MSGTKVHSNYEDLITFTRASAGHALRPVSYGDELVDNGTFDSDVSGWTAGGSATLSIVSGELKVLNPSSANYGYAVQAISTTVGAIYQLDVDFNYIEANGLVRVGTTSGGDQILTESLGSADDGSHRFTFVATTATTHIRVGLSVNTVDVEARFDNVSVKEVLFDQPDGTLTLFEHPDNIPRVEWDSAGNRLGLLVEEQRINLVTDSAGAGSDTLTSNSSQTSSQTNSLTGLDDAFLVQATATGINYRGQAASVTSGTSYTASRFLKAGTTNFAQLSMGSSGFGSDVYANFDLSDGTVATESNCDASITNMGGGWYRCSITKAATTTTSATSPNYLTPVASGTSAIRVATSGDNVYQFGAQTEAGSFPTSYIKTTGSTATRSADVASIPVADFGFNTAVGSIVAEVGAHNTDSNAAAHYTLSKTTLGSEWVSTYSSSANVAFRVREGGSDQGVITVSDDIRTSGAKTGFAFKEDDFAAVVNGGSVSTDTSGSMASGIEELKIAGFGSNPRQLCGHIKSIKYYPRRLSNAQLVELTS